MGRLSRNSELALMGTSEEAHFRQWKAQDAGQLIKETRGRDTGRGRSRFHAESLTWDSTLSL